MRTRPGRRPRDRWPAGRTPPDGRDGRRDHRPAGCSRPGGCRPRSRPTRGRPGTPWAADRRGCWGTPNRARPRGPAPPPRPRAADPIAATGAAPGRDTRDGHGGRADLVRDRLTDEHHLDRLSASGRPAAQARDRDEEVQAAGLTGGGLVVDGETAPAEPGEQGLRRAAGQYHRRRGVGRRAARGQDVATGLAVAGWPAATPAVIVTGRSLAEGRPACGGAMREGALLPREE